MSEIIQFRATVYHYYHNNPRNVEMPWRLDNTPYHVLLSEFMLQQTQVSRVIDYFNTFVMLWPNVDDLASASLSEVLINWQGLGYNRRAKFLHHCVKEIVAKYDGKIPQSETVLQSLPGVGIYTSSAIMAFAFNYPTIVLETNIRRAIIHWFFAGQTDIQEEKIRNQVALVLDTDQPRIWYWALMDYGAYLSKKIDNPNRRSKIYRKQSKFEGSNRQVRGAIIRAVLANNVSKRQLISQVSQQVHASFKLAVLEDLIEYNLQALQHEGLLVASEKEHYYIP